MNILICLIGSNPLPNYIVTKYLLIDKTKRKNDCDKIPVPDKVIFLHSEDTKDVAENIIKLDEKFESIIHKIPLSKNERSKEKISGLLKDELDKEKKISSIHLNYTGGTKPMAVHSYDTVCKYAESKNIKLITSDLDPKEYRIQINGDGKYPSNSDLRKFVPLEIEQLLELHGMKFENQNDDKLNSKELNINLEKFKKNYIEMIEKNKRKNELKELSEKLKKGIRNKNIIEKDKSEFEKTFDKLCENELGERYSDMKQLKYMVEFASGHWLEEYIQDKLIKVKDKYNLSEAKRSVEASYNKRKCELDVVLNRGYEMHLFTCTTSQKIQTVKGKAFEGMYRASQLGGDQAKTIIVHLMPKKEKCNPNNEEQLKNDLSSFNAKNTTYSICLDDIKDTFKLDKKLREIFS